MRLNNRALALGLGSCLVLAGCVGGGDNHGGPRLADPTYGDAPQGGYPQGYPRPAPQDAPPADAATAAPAGAPHGAPSAGRGQAAPLAADELDAGPPPSNGPSATSGRGEARYDEVGYATWYGNEMAGNRTASGDHFDPNGFTAAHRTLPLGSYAEITALDSGRTILVRITDRGPRQTNLLIDLSQGAAQALGVTGRRAVRVRSVTASPSDLAAFRAGQPGSPRLDTPPALLTALRQRLTGGPSTPPPASPAPQRLATTRAPVARATPMPVPAPARPVAKAPAAKPPVAKGGFYVQVAAFSSQPRAASLAKSLGGQAIAAGPLWRVRLGPYATRNDASRARDGAAARGYGDARVVRED